MPIQFGGMEKLEKMKKELEECGIVSSQYANTAREITREQWMKDVFPEWGTFLNNQIDKTVIEKGNVGLWWLGGPSWAIKTSSGEVFALDNYAGPSIYSTIGECGVCRTAGTPLHYVLKLTPQLIDPWGYKRLDAMLHTHHHLDHCDLYSVKAALESTTCKFVGPKYASKKLISYGVPDDRLTVVKPGDSIKIGNTEFDFLYNYDEIATRSGVDVTPDTLLNLEEIAVSILVKTDGGNILFLGDSLYSNAYFAIGKEYEIDVVIPCMGHNAPGATDKMTPYDVMRTAEALNAKVVIPDHYDIWSFCQIDTSILERLVAEITPQVKTCILNPGAMYVYPRDKDMKRYKYYDSGDMYEPVNSWEYGHIARQLKEMKKNK